jgi:hypothetical protein
LRRRRLWRRRYGWRGWRNDLRLDNRRLFFDLRFSFCLDDRLLRLSLHNFLNDSGRDFGVRSLDGYDIVAVGGLLASVRHKYTELAAKPVREAVFNCVRMRCHRHAHVLQFANDLCIVAIKLAGKLVNSKLWHSLFKPSKLPDAGKIIIYFTLLYSSGTL